jgi:predicted ATP-grasp superfamily ATP-dependent carboligase
MSKTVLLTLGRLPKALELARALRRAGARVIIAEPFGLHVCRVSSAVSQSCRLPAPNSDPEAYLDALETLIRREKVDIVVPVSEEILHVSKLAGRLPADTQLFCPQHAHLARLHDKLAFNQTARALGLAVPETHAGPTPGALALAQRRDYIVKPVHGCSGIGVALRRKGDKLEADDRQSGRLVQARLPGRHVSSFSIAHNGRILTTVLYRGLIFSGTVCVCFERIAPCIRTMEWIRRFVAAEAYSGFISFDFIEDADGQPQAIECNPRLTSGVHFLAPEGLARAVLDPGQPAQIDMRPVRSFQEGHTALLEVYAAAFKPAELFRRLKAFLTSRDVLFRLDDPLPFLLFTPMSWPVIHAAIAGHMSLGEAATRDILWNPDRPAAGVAAQPSFRHDAEQPGT